MGRGLEESNKKPRTFYDKLLILTSPQPSHTQSVGRFVEIAPEISFGDFFLFFPCPAFTVASATVNQQL